MEGAGRAEPRAERSAITLRGGAHAAAVLKRGGRVVCEVSVLRKCTKCLWQNSSPEYIRWVVPAVLSL